MNNTRNVQAARDNVPAHYPIMYLSPSRKNIYIPYKVAAFIIIFLENWNSFIKWNFMFSEK